MFKMLILKSRLKIGSKPQHLRRYHWTFVCQHHKETANFEKWSLTVTGQNYDQKTLFSFYQVFFLSSCHDIWALARVRSSSLAPKFEVQISHLECLYSLGKITELVQIDPSLFICLWQRLNTRAWCWPGWDSSPCPWWRSRQPAAWSSCRSWGWSLSASACDRGHWTEAASHLETSGHSSPRSTS